MRQAADPSSTEASALPRLAFEFAASVDENAECLAEMLRADPEFRTLCAAERRRRIVRAALVCLVAGLSVLSLQVILRRRIFDHPVLVALCVFAIPLVAYMLVRISWRTFFHAYAERAAWGIVRNKQWRMGQPVRITILEEGVRWSTRYGDALARWVAVSDCRASAAGLCIHLGRMEGVMIPASAFDNASHVEAVAAIVQQRRRGEGVDTDAVAARVLASHDLYCPKCQYQMRGLASARCPECATDIDLELLLRVEEARRPE